MKKINRRNFFAVLLAPFLARKAAQEHLFDLGLPWPALNGFTEDLNDGTVWDGWVGHYPTYGSIRRYGPVSKLLPVDENGEDVLTRVTKNYMAAEEGLRKSLGQAANDYFNPPFVYRVHGKD